MNQFARDLTKRDLSSHLGSVTSGGGLNVAFEHVKVRLQSIDPEFNGKHSTRLAVFKQPKGDRYTVAARYITEEQAMADPELSEAYQMFKMHDEVPTSGTPLHELPGVTQSQIGLMAINGIRSIEDLVHLSDDLVSQVGYEVVAAKKLATAWFNKREGEAETIKAAEMQANHEAQMTALVKRLEAIEARNIELEAQQKIYNQMGANQGISSAQAQSLPNGAIPGGNVGQGDMVSDFDLDEDDGFMSSGPDSIDGNDDLGDDFDPLSD